MSANLPHGRGIYFIRVGNYGYVGQTVDFNSRLGAHIRNAYYGYGDHSAQQMYWKMRIHRIQDIEITIYPDSMQYGIPNFQDKLKSFLDEWAPVGKRVNQDSSVTPETIEMDFAEIYHILYHLIKKDCILTNIEIGGQVADWTSRINPIQSRLSKKGDAIKLITRQTPPGEAYQTFLKGAGSSMEIAPITEEVYEDLLKENWKEILETKYIPLMSANVSKREAEKFSAIVRASKLKSWPQFVAEDIRKEITKNISYWIQNSLKRSNITTSSSIRAESVEDLSEYIKKHFLIPRIDIVNRMFTALFRSAGQTATATETLTNRIDISRLGEYIAEVVKTLITRKTNKNDGTVKFGFTSSEKNILSKQNFRPIRTSVIWKSHFHKNHSASMWLLEDFNISSGKLVENNWLKYRSFLLFDYLMGKTKQLNFVEARFNKIPDRYYIPMYSLEPAEWLSTRLHNMYNLYAPGYSEEWFEFYRPMISLWRKYHDRPDFGIITVYEKDRIWEYLGYESSTKDALILYRNIKNFINDVTDWDQLKKY